MARWITSIVAIPVTAMPETDAPGSPHLNVSSGDSFQGTPMLL
jgi:hypothetical protein